MKTFTRTLLVAMTVILTGTAYSQTFEQSLEAYDRKDYKVAFAGFKSSAEQGDANAQFHLALMFADGLGVPKDDQQVAFWYCRAAEQGNVSAQYNLGLINAYGMGVPEDVEKAYFWWLLSSIGGNQLSVKNRDMIEKRLTLQQRANAQVAARIWTPVPNGRPTACVWPPVSPQGAWTPAALR